MAEPGLVEVANRLIDVRGTTAAEVRAMLVELYDFWLRRAAGESGVDGESVGVALAAVGGLGRRELVPFADLDLVLLHDGRPEADRIAEAVWYPLWDSGIPIDHVVRTPDQALEVAAEDVRTAIGLLDLRPLAGDESLVARVRTEAREQWRRLARRVVPELLAATRARWERSGEIAQSARPDVKYGRGGLRDLAVLDALAVAQLTDRPNREVNSARELLLDVRTELRRLLRRARDVLEPPEATAVATRLGFDDRFALARALSGGTRAVAYALDVAFRAAKQPPSIRRRPTRVPLDDGVVLHGSEVALARRAHPTRDPFLVLRVAAASAVTGAPIAQGTLAVLAASAPEPRPPWPDGARDTLLRLLGAGEGVVAAVEALDRAGLWGRLFPEWGAVRDLTPREPLHSWTVDAHLLRTCVEAARLSTSVSRPDLLLLAAFLHDIGKGRDTDHSELGARLAERVAERLGVTGRDGTVLVGAVRHHLLLIHTALRRDITERATVERVATTLGGDAVLLEVLRALTEADARATGPGVWTPWRARLVDELVSRCRALMRGEEPTLPPRELTGAQRELAVEAIRTTTGRTRVDPGSGDGPELPLTVEFAAPSGRALFAPAMGVLAANSLRVLSAVVRGHLGATVGVFTVTPVFGDPPDPALLRDQFARAVTRSLHLGARLAEKERAYASRTRVVPQVDPVVLWFDDEVSGREVVMELRAVSRIGLLYRVACVLESRDVRVRWARIAELGAGVVASFAVAPGRGTPDTAWRTEVTEAVLNAAGPTPVGAVGSPRPPRGGEPDRIA